jgi:hypothetical protein
MASFMNTVSVGSVGNYRRIVNVADPTGAHDAVTLGYLQNNYSGNNVIANLSSEIDALNKQMSKLDGASGSAAATTAAAADQPAASGTATTAVATPATPSNGTAAGPVATTSATSASKQVDRVAQSGDSPISGTASGSKPANSQTQQAVASSTQYTDQQTNEALQSANTYTDAQNAQTLSSAKAYTDQALASYVTTDSFNQYQQQVNARFSQQDERIDRISAMSTAMVQMAASAAGIDTPNRVGLGVGDSHGQSALSIGYQRALGKKATVTIGGSVSGNESSVGAGVGFGW